MTDPLIGTLVFRKIRVKVECICPQQIMYGWRSSSLCLGCFLILPYCGTSRIFSTEAQNYNFFSKSQQGSRSQGRSKYCCNFYLFVPLLKALPFQNYIKPRKLNLSAIFLKKKIFILKVIVIMESGNVLKRKWQSLFNYSSFHFLNSNLKF